MESVNLGLFQWARQMRDCVCLPSKQQAFTTQACWVPDAGGWCCRRPGYRSTAEHILTLCKDKEYAVPFLAGQYQKSLIDHALHRLDSQVSMVSHALLTHVWIPATADLSLSAQSASRTKSAEQDSAVIAASKLGMKSDGKPVRR